MQYQYPIRENLLLSMRSANRIRINQKSIVNFASNDYLQLATHSEVIHALLLAAKKFGISSSSSPQICGYMEPHYQLEIALSQFLQREKTMLFSSGYLANLAALGTFATRKSVIIADKFCHASLIDGAHLSRAKLLRFQHQNISHAEYLGNLQKDKHKIFVTESVFSMEASITDLPNFVQITKHEDSMLIVDDAHGFGILGKNGAGCSEYFCLNAEDIGVLITPFGKAFGSMGAAISGNGKVIDAIKQKAKTYRYSTAVSPAIANALLASLIVIKSESWRREKLFLLANFFQKAAREYELPFVSSSLPIQCLIVNSNEMAYRLQQQLLQKNLLVGCIRPPTVPKNSSRIRILLNCMHTENQILFLLDQIKIIYEQLRKN